MPIKLKIEEIKDRIRAKRYILLDESEIINTKTKVNISDELGYKYYTRLENVLVGNPYKFHKDNPYSVFNIKNYIKINNINTMLKSDTYVSNKGILDFECECGDLFSISWNEFKTGQTQCKNCTGGINREKKDTEYVINEFNKYGFKIINMDGYSNSKSKITVSDENGYKFHMSYNDLNYNLKNNCESDCFSKFNPYTIENIKLFININGYNNNLISDKYVDCDGKLIFTCECCRKPYSVSFKNFRKCDQTKCKKCSKCQSTLETKVEKYLLKNNIKYNKEVRFKDCINERELPFDFVIYNNDDTINIIIECDGKQHYETVEFFSDRNCSSLDTLEKIKIRDKIKNKYCKDNNIKLLRIPYWEFKNKKYLEILKNNISLQPNV